MTVDKIYTTITKLANDNKKMLAILVDPDKQDFACLNKTIAICNNADVDFFFVGGSLLTSGDLAKTVRFIKENSSIPVILFPGSPNQITNYADGILFLSLISGRNPEFLIGNQVVAAPFVKKSNLEVLSTGYMLVDGGTQTTASYVSNTNPLPYDKPEIAAVTALAGEYLGMKLIYIDGGSGAKKCVSLEMIKKTKEIISIPLLIGGGIRTPQAANEIYLAGADMLVIGNGAEENRALITEIAAVKKQLNNASLVRG
ncbi:MAG: geranylgeranylglyceryl/heptaprenylglyceryl phosphate synthase [Bacteroidetes bacterium HGW-Bacteroidetes-12]|nr:MAG: geranylgeranylglyceryl/heptaprenylglyceryl phosphate synthase [Bacteroidetes bacterium HGW-Bacteroidetes-12]